MVSRFTRRVQVVLLLVLLGSFCMALMGCRAEQATEIRFWHSYTGRQAEALLDLVGVYNRTEGRDRNVEVIAYYRGDREELSRCLHTYSKEELPEIIESTGTAAYQAYLNGKIACAENYLSGQALAGYAESFLSSGRFTENTGVYVFPFTVNADICYINRDALNEFGAACPGISTGSLRCWDTLYDAAAQYYRWTDAMTETPDDGYPFLAIENVGNYLLTVSNQYAASIIQAGHKGINIILDYEILRMIWNFYYSAAVRGYLSLSRDGVDNQMARAHLICYLSSTANADRTVSQYYNLKAEKRATNVLVQTYPGVSVAQPVIPLDTTGVVVVDKDGTRNAEAYHFLNWFCTNRETYRFYTEARAMPVARNVLGDRTIVANIDTYVRENGKNPVVSLVSTETYTELYVLKTYRPVAFPGSEQFVQEIGDSLYRAARLGRYNVETLLEQGTAYEDAVAQVDTDAAFAQWLEALNEIKSRY